MKNGALEASFNASEASTRELINDGMPKLKEVLEKSGMELALLDVNVRQNSQNGGNPTPGRQPSSGQGLSAVKGDTEKTGPAAKPAATGKQTGNQDGLDVLV
jgi:flagellar hook-length control protein FliK